MVKKFTFFGLSICGSSQETLPRRSRSRSHGHSSRSRGSGDQPRERQGRRPRHTGPDEHYPAIRRSSYPRGPTTATRNTRNLDGYDESPDPHTFRFTEGRGSARERTGNRPKRTSGTVDRRGSGPSSGSEIPPRGRRDSTRAASDEFRRRPSHRHTAPPYSTSTTVDDPRQGVPPSQRTKRRSTHPPTRAKVPSRVRPSGYTTRRRDRLDREADPIKTEYVDPGQTIYESPANSALDGLPGRVRGRSVVARRPKSSRDGDQLTDRYWNNELTEIQRTLALDLLGRDTIRAYHNYPPVQKAFERLKPEERVDMILNNYETIKAFKTRQCSTLLYSVSEWKGVLPIIANASLQSGKYIEPHLTGPERIEVGKMEMETGGDPFYDQVQLSIAKKMGEEIGELKKRMPDDESAKTPKRWTIGLRSKYGPTHA